MSLGLLDVPRLFRRIADALAAAIDAGEFVPGERLPGERQLAKRLGVSRSSLREALAALELEGRVEIRVGSGVYVRPRAGRPRSEIVAPGPSPFDVIEARRLVEAETAALAARHATREQIAAIECAFDRLSDDMRANRAHSEGDRLFHLRIAGASGNTALLDLVTRLWETHQAPLATRMEALFVTGRRRRDNIIEHRLILDAIRAHDSARARRAMRDHLRNVERQRLAMMREEN